MEGGGRGGEGREEAVHTLQTLTLNLPLLSHLLSVLGSRLVVSAALRSLLFLSWKWFSPDDTRRNESIFEPFVLLMLIM